MSGAVAVRRLTLRASRRELVGRAAVALEDAFRTASLPGASSAEVLVVRRLDLGAIRAGISPQGLALRLEARLRGITPVRGRAGLIPAEDAAAIAFPDRAEALATLLVAARRGAKPAWWWASLLPGAPGPALPDLLVAAIAAAAGSVTVAALLARLLALDELDAILAVLPPGRKGLGSPRSAATPLAPVRSGVPVSHAVEDVDRVAGIAPLGDGAGGAAGDGSAPTAGRAPRIAGALPTAWRRTLRHWTNVWGIGDSRSLWLTEMALVRQYGPFAAASAPEVVLAVVEPPAPPPATAHAAGVVAGRRPHAPLAAPAPREADVAAAAAPVAGNAPEADEPAPRGEPSSWRATRHAGLLFLLPAFASLGIDRLDPARPDLPLRLLNFLALRLLPRPEDGMRAWLPEPLPDPPPARFVAPDDWRRLLGLETLEIRRVGIPGRRALTGRHGRILAGMLTPGDVAGLRWPARRAPELPAMAPEARLLAGLALAVSAFLRRRAGLSLRHLTRRPGQVLASATHIEVRLHAREIEADIRRAGLDVDPGWVPWLGRVVTFTYVYDDA